MDKIITYMEPKIATFIFLSFFLGVPLSLIGMVTFTVYESIQDSGGVRGIIVTSGKEVKSIIDEINEESGNE